MKSLKLILLNILLFPSFFSFVFADNAIASLSLEPEAPEPKSAVTLTLESYYFDVNIAMITWKVNGVIILKGQGEKNLTVRTGNVGDSSKITVFAETTDGTSVEQSINITPSSVVLLYEAPKSYVPLLYEGRSLPSDGATVRVSALPQISDNGVLVSPSSLSYAWYVDDTVISSLSGAGKQFANITLNYLQNETEVKVLIRSPGGNTASKTIHIQPHKVMPLLYVHDPIFGSQFSSLVGKRFEAVNDFTLSLEPFYVSKEGAKLPDYSWFLDGYPSTPLGGRLLSLHPKQNDYGSKLLTVKVTGPSSFLQQEEVFSELIFDTRK